MIYCKKCILPNTRPNLEIDNQGFCNACINHQIKKTINWESRKRDFENLIKQTKKKLPEYDCVIPVSGGKDSTWQVLKCLEYGLKILAVTWKAPSRNKTGAMNLKNLISLGVDHIDFTINPEIEKKFIYNTFIKAGSPAIPMHFAIWAIPVKIAKALQIPLVIYGENSAIEYGGIKKNEDSSTLDVDWIAKYGVTQKTNIENWASLDLPLDALSAYQLPKINKNSTKVIFLGHYFKWNPQLTKDLATAHGFKKNSKGALTGIYNFADIDDEFISIHHWLKWYKYGFTRAFDNLSLDIRNEIITREKALQTILTIGSQTPDNNIDLFCEYLKITKNTFFEISEKFRNQKIWRKNSKNIWEIPNFIIKDWRWG